MIDAPLIVPIALDALVVNDGVLGRDAFRWWSFAYASLRDFKSPEPEAFQAGISHQDPGIYLHWTLPTGLRHGKKDQKTGEVAYPLVPNRWLVLRLSGQNTRQATAWVIESDCPYTSFAPPQTQPSSQFLMDPDVLSQWRNSPDPHRRGSGLDPAGEGPQITTLGVAFPADSWNERDPNAIFLTAMAPGNHLFSAYVQHGFNVFAFRDPLDGISADPALGYQVIGWYSDTRKDVLGAWRNAADPDKAWSVLLDELGWSAARGVKATTSLYQGMVLGVPWVATGGPPAPDPLQMVREKPMLDVAIGNSTPDALSALLASQFAGRDYDARKLTLLQAFQYDLLPVLNQVNGKALVEWKVRDSWFGSTPGGYSWTLVPPESDGPPVPLADAESKALVQLNGNSALLDAHQRVLFSLQWQLHGTWYKLGQFESLPAPVRGQLPITQEVLLQQVDLSTVGGLAAQTVAQMATVRRLTLQVPQPIWLGSKTAEDALRVGIDTFAKATRLSSTHRLKAVPKPRYWHPNNPVVLISGLSAPPAQPTMVTTRGSDALITALTVGSTVVSAQKCAAVIASRIGGGLPAKVNDLVAEFFMLDPASASSIAKAAALDIEEVAAAIASRTNYAGTVPTVTREPWRQPWQPLLLEWRAAYSHVPAKSGAWEFDGTDYHLTPTKIPTKLETQALGSICNLGPSAQFTFQGKLKSFVDKYGRQTDLAQIYDWIDAIDQWQFLGQELSGFNESLALRDPRAYRRPGAAEMVATSNPVYPIASLTGYNARALAGDSVDPYILPPQQSGQVHSVPLLANGTNPSFHGLRQGQFHLTDLRVYDKFGRVLELIGSGQRQGLYSDTNFPLVRSAALLPDVSVQPGVAAVVQMAPRLLQPSRLDFDLIDQANDSAVLGLADGVNPVCGWLLPNHLDHSLSLYGPDGSAMGEFRLVVNEQGARIGEWQPTMQSNVKTLGDVAKVSPHLARFLGSAGLSNEAGFDAFMAAIDEALWTIDPLGRRGDQNLSVLIGRPLALVRARLELNLDGPTWTASDWAATFPPAVPDLFAISVPIRLGDQATRQDGTIGYFSEDYLVFNSVSAPASGGPDGSAFVRQIGPLGESSAGGGQNYVSISIGPGGGALLTLLIDPRASVHAISGLLPVKQLDLPAQFVDPALARLEVGFRVGPLLTTVRATRTQGGVPAVFPEAIDYPSPVEKAGAWSWCEPKIEGGWVSYGIGQGTQTATFGAPSATLREGLLRWQLDLTETTIPPGGR